MQDLRRENPAAALGLVALARAVLSDEDAELYESDDELRVVAWRRGTETSLVSPSRWP
jgi:hypothetical protein